MITDPGTASQFTVTTSLPKVGVFKQMMEPLTSCIDIICTEGQNWKFWRSRFNPGFSQRNLNVLLPEILEEVGVFVDGLKYLSGKDGNWGPVFQLHKKTINLTFDVICRAALDIRLHEQTNKSDGILKRSLLDQLRLMGIMANAARAIPIGRMPWHNAAVIRNNRTMRDYLLPHIQRKLEMGAENLNKKTILDLAIHQSDGDQQQDLTQKPNAEFVDSLISNLKAFLFAGHDTTASSICFMTKLLQDNPDCLDKLRNEHDAVLGTDIDKTSEVLKASPHLLQSLPYTVGVIKETLRLYPLAATVRESHAGLRLTGTESSLEYPMDGFGLWLSAPTIQRHPGYWTRADEFLPERWLVNDGPLRPPKNAWVPFSLGPRNCIGMELAMMELKLVSVFTARTFSIEEAWTEWDQERGAKTTTPEMVDGQRLYQVNTTIVHPKDGMPVHVRMRS
ncbi:hypothetical protein G7054_g12362 [Neopestalotiopsis clavispora]|nr:hypothetical protein G7054_g12362 [Neopestalotiopsis clavispora]